MLITCAITLLGAACTRSADDSALPAEKTPAAKDDMAGMPGMTDTTKRTSVAFSAAQIANGHVRWSAPAMSAMSGGNDLPAQLVMNEDRTARLAASAQSRVLTVHVSPGDRVAKGARLVTLQSPDAAMAQSDAAKAEAELASRRAAAAYAKAARERAERLLALKAIPRQDYERAVADDELARSAVTQAESELQRARSVAEQLGVDLRDGSMTLVSPISGVVTARQALPGAVVGAGAPLVTVTDPDSLWLTVALPEQFTAGARPGVAIRFVVAMFPTDTFVARIQSIAPAFDSATRALTVRGVVANGRGRLRPEMYARAWLSDGAARMLTVPEGAVQRLDGKSVVFVVHADSAGAAHFEGREVVIGPTSNGRTVILRGVSMTDLVVTEGGHAVKSEFTKGKLPKMEMSP
jgi:RND family efflux transporter MFP subunit